VWCEAVFERVPPESARGIRIEVIEIVPAAALDDRALNLALQIPRDNLLRCYRELADAPVSLPNPNDAPLPWPMGLVEVELSVPTAGPVRITKTHSNVAALLPCVNAAFQHARLGTPSVASSLHLRVWFDRYSPMAQD
jgi:hypothetical protein